MLFPFLSFTSKKFNVSVVHTFQSDSVSNNNTINSVQLGDPHPTRTFYLLVAGRTNTGTGNRRITGASLIIDSVTYTGTILEQHAATATNNPCSLIRIEAPVGTVGNLNITVSGNADGLVSWGGALYSTKGTFSEKATDLDLGTTTNFTTVRGDVVLHLAYANTGLSASSQLTFVDLDATGNGSRVICGRVDPTQDGSLSIVSNTATRCIALLLG